jgi:hypothetical protein
MFICSLWTDTGSSDKLPSKKEVVDHTPEPASFQDICWKLHMKYIWYYKQKNHNEIICIESNYTLGMFLIYMKHVKNDMLVSLIFRSKFTVRISKYSKLV